MHPATRLAVTPDENRQKWAALAGARVGGAGRRLAARRADPGGGPDGRRHAAAADRGAALRPGPLGGVRRRSVVALAHDAAGHRHELRDDLAAARALGHRRRAGAGDDRRDEPRRCPASPIASAWSCATRTSAPVANAEVAIEMTRAERREAAADARRCRARRTGAMRWRRGSISPASTGSTRSRRAAATRIGTASRPVLVGGVDLEMTQPRLNEAVLRRLAAETQRPLPRARTRRGRAAVAAARIARRGRHAGDARPLAQWVEPAGDRRLAGAEWVAAAHGWDWRDDRSHEVTRSEILQKKSFVSFVFVVVSLIATNAFAENALGGDHFRRVGRREVRRADGRRGATTCAPALVDRYRFKPEFVKMFVDETATTGDKGTAENVRKLFARDQEDVGARTTSCWSSCSATAPTTATSPSSISSART